MVKPKFSIVIPVYRNEESIGPLLSALEELSADLAPDPVEVIFVVDGSPDRSFELLEAALPRLTFASQLVLLSRNFGAFSAIRCGLKEARGDYIGVMAADLRY